VEGVVARLSTAGARSEHTLYIDGAWVDAIDRGTARATSPVTGREIATVAMAGPADVDAAVAAARRAAPGWAATGAFERAAVLRRMAAAVEARADDLAVALTTDQGKPLAEARDEVAELGVYLRTAAEDAVRVEGRLPPSVDPTRRVLLQRVPLGVVAIIVPWNWPYTMAAELFAPALAAGNTVVWLAAPTTAVCSARLAEVLTDPEVGLPPGVLGFLNGAGPVAGDALAGHPGLDAIGFIGSVATGRAVATRAPGKVQILELGGNGPLVVLDDADLGLAVDATLEAAYLCAGQSCTAGERFLVQRSVRPEFVERLGAAVESRIRLGDPFDATTTMGPLNNEGVAGKTDDHVASALADGARLVTGGHRAGGFPTELYWEPTVLDAVTPDMLIAREETFGPVAPVVEVADDDEALALANGSPYGLLCAVFTGDLGRGLRFAEAVRTGWVNINGSTNYWESHLPFGGRAGSASGHGRVGGASVLEQLSELKTIVYRV
jgi:succinate-semialdehyde dehydrogenase/glutarate-semialdehyde dehydrogenase